MRIAHVTATFPPYYSGTGMVCYHNALELARRGHEVTVFTAAYPPGKHVYPPEITVRRLPVLFRFGNAPFLPGLFMLEGFDIVHLHYPFYFGAEMVFLRSLINDLTYVVTYYQDVLFNSFLRYPERLHHRLLGKRILTRARRILISSWDYAQASRLKELIPLMAGVMEEFPFGVNPLRFHPAKDSSECRLRYRIETADRVILFVGALDRSHYFKGVEVLLQALTQLPNRGVKLLVVGEGNLRPSYERQALQLGLEKRVIFCGQVPDEALPSYYAGCDLLVLPSTTMGEAFGVVLLEAMACGKPVIASRLPGVRVVVSDGEDGLLVKPGDVGDLAEKIQTLLDNPQLRRTMGEHGRAKVEARYNWSVIGDELESLYLSLMTR